jgi:FkbM family methyltransferase
MASLFRAFGRRLRHYVQPLVGFWDVIALLQDVRARMGALEEAARSSRATLEEEVRAARAVMEATREAVAQLSRDSVSATTLATTLAAEIDRLDGYLLHHAATLRQEMADANGNLLHHSEMLRQQLADATTVLEEGMAVMRTEIRTVDDVMQMMARGPKHACLGENVDVLLLAGGFDLIVPTQEEGLLAYFLRHGTDSIEPGVQAVLKDRLRPGAVAVDVGANVGVHALAMAAAVGPEGRVLCFEPLPHLAAALARTLRLNNFGDRARVEQVALTDTLGETTFNRAVHSPLSSLYALPDAAGVTSLLVRTSTMDACVPPGGRVDFVKIDVEGAEPLVWRGMRRVLSENERIVIVLEWSASHFRRSGEDQAAFLAMIREAGFNAYKIEDSDPSGRLTPLSDQIATLEAANVLLTREPLAERDPD